MLLETAPYSARETRNSSLKTAGVLAGGQSNRTHFKLSPDTCPSVPPSGKAGDVDLFARGLCKEIILPTPGTPDLGDIRMRHRRRTGAGEITTHWGAKTLRIPVSSDHVHGKKVERGENVAKTFRAGERFGIAEYIEARGESIYESTIREPLGKVSGKRLPFKLPEKGLSFGKATPRGPVDAKETIFPRNVTPDSEETIKRYQRTHGDFGAGEMNLRGYDWPAAVLDDPYFQFGFAAMDARSGRGVKEALSVDHADETGNYPVTRVVNQSSENYKEVTEHCLGERKNLMQGPPKLPSSHAYGQPNIRGVPASIVMRGFYSDAERLPDSDLGRCTVPGRRNFMTNAQFGVPTVRCDKSAPPFERRSVANSTNYGDDLTSYSLIFPNKWRFQGISDEDFQVRRGMDELRDIFESAGFSMAPPAFAEIFDAAVEACGDGEHRASLQAFMQVYSYKEFGAAECA